MGITKTPSNRFSRHLAEKDGSHRANWISKLQRQGMIPSMQIIQEVPEAFGAQSEIYWIAYFRSVGCQLTNSTDGGEGNLGWCPSEETRSKISISLKRYYDENPEVRTRIGDRRRGKPGKCNMSSEMLQRFIEKAKQPKSAETRAKMSAAKMGRKHSPEQTQKRKNTLRRHREERRAAECLSSI